nr:hypothetical protein DGKKSRWO_DGKKSRWO_CDS_0115 [uncultured phage]CAI9752292.1 hypothetical protein CVNMHQAP_CVNMHQAP_CDS_0115 [uncultured phage]
MNILRNGNCKIFYRMRFYNSKKNSTFRCCWR